ncbi:MAG TPA: aspartyl/asparaginyl beta-hydroxylase domain-containing protein [Burkholderiaceae bacterium]|nr:aspartyl/asparaginyl beta-hydroxylase domain-containing protein [Burkholderiaceae bacterium]
MSINFLAPKFLVLYVFVFSSLYLHFRGRLRLPILRQIGNHSTLLAPYNVLMYAFSAVPTRPYLDVKDFPEMAALRDNWETIREEARALLGGGGLKAASDHVDIGFNSFFQRGWRRFYLKWYDAPPPSAVALCPKTVALLQSIPSVNAAMFALLPAGSRLNEHRDPSAASLRYHLGLMTPNSDDCFINVDGQPYSWRDGKDVMFDETYLHFAENRTDKPRLILFCDVERPLHGAPIRALNRLFERIFLRAAATPNEGAEDIGWINRLYKPVGVLKQWLSRAKNFNKPLFNGCKYLLIIALLYWIFLT